MKQSNMERKIGETFEYEGKKLRVEANGDSDCKRCYFNEICPNINQEIIGECLKIHRQDKTSVAFVEINDEQPKLNLCEILKDCPRGTKLYSTVLGYVIFQGIIAGAVYPIIVTCENGVTEDFTADGKMFIDYNGECTLFPSKEQRDWSKFDAPWLKKERFDPKTLKPFDRVIVRVADVLDWFCELFSYSYIGFKGETKFFCGGSPYFYCIPYNDDTKHLVGTKEEAPEFYRYWEEK